MYEWQNKFDVRMDQASIEYEQGVNTIMTRRGDVCNEVLGHSANMVLVNDRIKRVRLHEMLLRLNCVFHHS